MRASNVFSRTTRFQQVYDSTCDLLRDWGVPFDQDRGCEVFYDDTLEHGGEPALSYYQDGEIVLCRRHVEEPLPEAQITLVHEITHYWCERFPHLMRKAHLFRVPRAKPLPLGAQADFPGKFHWLEYDSSHRDYLGTYSQVDSEECLAEFMAHLVVKRPDLRSVTSRAARRRFQACRDMLRKLRNTYREMGFQQPMTVCA